MPTIAVASTDIEPLFAPERRAACVGAVILVSLLAFEAMAVAAAMPAITAALGGDALYALAFGGMLATSIVGMVVAGHLCDQAGAGRTGSAGLAAFTAGLLLAGAANHMLVVVAGRVVQGLGGGMLGVALYVGAGQLVPKALHPRLFALFAAAWVLPGLLGPPVAAMLVATLGWRSVFLAVASVAPLAALLLMPALVSLPRPGRAAKAAAAPRAVAWAVAAAAGALLLNAAGGLPSLPVAWAAALAGAVLAGAAARALLPRGALVAARGLPAVIVLRGLLAAGFATAEAFVPLYLTRMQGWSLANAGFALSTGALLWSAGSAVQSRLHGEASRRHGLLAGFVLVAAGIAAAALPALLGVAGFVLVVGWAMAGFGIGLAFPMLSVLTLKLSSPAEQGRNASALQLSDALCSSAALAAAGLVLAQGGGQSRAGFAGVMLIASALPAVGALLARRASAR
jgi:MFS family permease